MEAAPEEWPPPDGQDERRSAFIMGKPPDESTQKALSGLMIRKSHHSIS
jgi:hypothetical protein